MIFLSNAIRQYGAQITQAAYDFVNNRKPEIVSATIAVVAMNAIANITKDVFSADDLDTFKTLGVTTIFVILSKELFWAVGHPLTTSVSNTMARDRKEKIIQPYLFEPVTETTLNPIIEKPDIIDIMIEENIDLTRHAEHPNAYSLLYQAVTKKSYPAFKKLVDAKAWPKDRIWELAIFAEIIKRDLEKFLNYLESCDLLKASLFSVEEQISLWNYVYSPHIGMILQNNGFDINVVGKKGDTPLLSLVQNYFSKPFPLDMQVELLVKLGANIFATKMDENGNKKNAIDLTWDCDVKIYLKEVISNQKLEASSLTPQEK